MIEERYPKEVVLKSGEEVVLRPIEESDKSAVLAFYKGMPVEEQWFYKEDPADPDVVQKWIQAVRSGEVLSVLALHEERVIAHAALLARGHGCRGHIGEVRIRITPDYRGKRLGNWMLFDLIRRGMDLDLEILRVDFPVGVENDAVEALRKWDFHESALLQGYLRDQDGAPRDVRILLKRLHKEWSDF
jgi:L-amino acid N-acyltransferase YncA